MRRSLTIGNSFRAGDKLAPYVDSGGDRQHEEHQRPRTRGECIEGPRPCPWVSCRHHLYLDVKQGGGIVINRPDLQVDELEESCSLDEADRGPQTLEAVGALISLTRERTRQVEEAAIAKMQLKVRRR